MRSNFKAICAASTKWQSEFEGILLMKDRKSNFTEHWCRLKGNLLVFCKTTDRTCEEIYGIVILEYFSIEVTKDSSTPNSFKLVFLSGETPIVLVAKSKEEYYSWKQHISEARCNNFTQKIQALKYEIESLQKQMTDLDLDTKNIEYINEGVDDGDKSGLEISFSCENLPHYAIEIDPNPSVFIYVYNSFTKEEKFLSKTEVIQNCRNPEFNKIIFIPENFFEPNILLRFVVYDIRDISTYTRHKIGSCEVSMKILQNDSNLMFKLINSSHRQIESILRVRVQEYHSKSSKSDAKMEVQSFQMIAEHNMCKSYKFPNKQNKDLRISEMMAESKFGLTIPIDYLKKLIEEESLLRESLSKFGSSDTLLEKLRTDRNIAISGIMRDYEVILTFMSQSYAEEKKFRPSCKKHELLSSFIPLNLHINRIMTVDATTNEMINYLDVISVGAFAAHHMKYKNGGLQQLAKNLPDKLEKNSAINVANAMIRQYVHIVQVISDQLQHLCSFITFPNDVKDDLVLIERKMARFYEILKHQFFTVISLQQVEKDYEQLTLEIRHFLDNSFDSLINIKTIQECAEKVKKSVDSISLVVFNILWPKILYVHNNESLNFEWAEFSIRENIAFSQALGAVITGIALACNSWTSIQWSQMAICGIPLYFEGLLTSYGDEIGMIEDMKWTIDKLADFTIIIKPDNKAPSFTFISLDRVEITCFHESWKNTPMEIRIKKKQKLHLHPYFLNVGINEQQTIADKISKNNMLYAINMNGYNSMKNYFERHVKNIGNSLQTCQGAEIIDSLNDLKYEIQKNKNKPVKILKIAEKISWAWGAIRFTSCKSAKDRTGMGLSLEQVRWLKNVAGMNPEFFTKALECIRSTGLRRDNCYKNIETKKYAFNHFQLLSFPKDYRPPIGTYGSAES